MTVPRLLPAIAALFAALMLTAGHARADGTPPAITLFKNPQCGCCEGHADYLRQNGFAVTVEPTHDLSLSRRMLSVPEALEGCHLMLVDGYVVEGHVPADPIRRLLAERPAITGISLPGMPQGSPGMSGTKTEPFTIYEIGADPAKVFAVE